MKIHADWLSIPSTRLVMDKLLSKGFQAYFVGGCVRNSILDTEVKDIDISTSAHPIEVLEMMKKAGLKAVPTGIEHGTVTVVVDKRIYEITTLREDIETDGRKAKVRFSKSILEDAKRRDFTINAIFSEQDGTILDPLNAIPDIFEKRIKFIGDPRERIKEDYLRILRFFRFLALFGKEDETHEAELTALNDLRDGLDTISVERKGDEILKLFAAPSLEYSICLMEKAKINSKIFNTCNHASLSSLIKLEERLDIAPCAIRRLAAYTGDNLKSQLRFSKKQAKAHQILRQEATNKKDAAELSYRYNKNLALDAILVRSSLQNIEPSKNIFSQIKKGSVAKFPIKPFDLAEYFSGPRLGEMLAYLEQKWIESDFTLNKEMLLATIK